jgi:hypothetical protein
VDATDNSSPIGELRLRQTKTTGSTAEEDHTGAIWALVETMCRRSRFGNVALTVAAAVWATAIGLGTHTVLRYENTSGTVGVPPLVWPSRTKILRRHDRYTLVMFAHPDCPCTRASLGEVESLMTELQGKLDVFVQFRKPGVSLTEVRASDLWKTAVAMPGVSARLDRDGAEALEFGAAVSGQTMLYDKDGKLIFSGGITASRGHVGDNPGARAILRGLGGADALSHAPVFGCSLRDPSTDEITSDSSWRKR